MSQTTSIAEQTPAAAGAVAPTELFVGRHIGPDDAQVREMLKLLGYESLDAMSDAAVPEAIRLRKELKLADPRPEHELLGELRAIAGRNKVLRTFIGQGYYGTITPPVILRNILENPGWYTQYTPYQAEISQGRLEALLNFQTMIADLTALPLANASMLDEGTAAAEAMSMCRNIVLERDESARAVFFVSDDCHPQTIAVVRTRARSQGIEVVIGDPMKWESEWNPSARPARKGEEGSDQRVSASDKPLPARLIGLLLQYPTTDGRIEDYSAVIQQVHAAGALVVMAADLLALTLIKPPGELGADIAIGSAQRFGVPVGFGGPHAAYMATRNEYARKTPGRIIGVSKDAHGQPALRLALQTREQHIRREKATSNICTAQVLLAIMAGMYAAWHGPHGLRRIAGQVHLATCMLAEGLRRLGHDAGNRPFFDTLRVRLDPKCGFESSEVLDNALKKGINLRAYADGSIGVSLDETVTRQDLESILQAFNNVDALPFAMEDLAEEGTKARRHEGTKGEAKGESTIRNPQSAIGNRKSPFLTHPVFNAYHSETEMLRYIFRLQSRDLSLAHAMIPLGSCTMKLNSTSEMIPVTWPQFAELHPFVPADQSRGYQRLFKDLERWLAEITGFAAVSLQPNAGSQGEYAGLLVIRAYHESRGQGFRNICLIPASAHGTNPASAVVAGFKTVAVACDAQGNIDLDDLRAKAKEHQASLACLMVTYPSTHGVFEEGIKEICKIVHDAGGQVYMDGANMNAQVGLCRPGDIGADVCHLNLHKTFCIPHGGGGPGMGPIAVDRHLKAFLPAVEAEPGVEEAAKGKDRQGDRETRRQGDRLPVGNRQSAVPQDSALRTQDSFSRVGMVASAPYGSASILPISWMYIALMGAAGLKRATQVAILNANYIAKRLEAHYPVLYRGKNGLCAHECILDCREFDDTTGVKVEDIAKRLMDYGFHAPTMSWPVPGTLMVEPTESESKAELDRFCDAMIQIRQEIKAIEEGRMDRQDNPLKNAPHTAAAVSADAWPHKYSREQAAYPTKWARQNKFWPAVGRVDNPYGDRNLVCACPPVEG